MVHEAAVFHHAVVELPFGVFSQEAQADQRGGGKPAGPGGGHGAVPVDGVVDAAVLAVPVGRHGDAAPDVAADEVHVPIGFPLGGGVTDAVFLLVQGVALAQPAQLVEAAHPLHIVQLVHVGGVDAEDAPPVLLFQLHGDGGAQGVGVLDGVTLAGVLQELVVHLIDAAPEADQAAATGGKGVYALQGDPGPVQGPPDGLQAEGELVGDFGEPLQLGGVVVHVGLEALLIPLEQGDFRGGRAGIDDKYLIRFFHRGPPNPWASR